MANPEHVRILKQGVEVWNRWRIENPSIRPDLRSIDLYNSDLHGTDIDPFLSHINLKDAIMFNSALRGANLPVQPLLLSSESEYGMFSDLLDYPWVLEPFAYDNLKMLLDSLSGKVIEPAKIKAQEIESRRKSIEDALSQYTNYH